MERVDVACSVNMLEEPCNSVEENEVLDDNASGRILELSTVTVCSQCRNTVPSIEGDVESDTAGLDSKKPTADASCGLDSSCVVDLVDVGCGSENAFHCSANDGMPKVQLDRLIC